MADWSAVLPASSYSSTPNNRRWDPNLTISESRLIFGEFAAILQAVNFRVSQNDVILNLVNPRLFSSLVTSQGVIEISAGGSSFRWAVTDADSLDTTDPYVWAFSGDKLAELQTFRNSLPTSGTQAGRITIWDGEGTSPFVTAPPKAAPADLPIAIGLPPAGRGVARPTALPLEIGLPSPRAPVAALPGDISIELDFARPRPPTPAAEAITVGLELGLPSPRAPVAALPRDIPIEIGLLRPIPSHEARGQAIGIAIDLPSPRPPVPEVQGASWTVELPASQYRVSGNTRRWISLDLDIPVGLTEGDETRQLSVVNFRISQNDIIINLVDPGGFTTQFLTRGTVQVVANGQTFRFTIPGDVAALDSVDPYIWTLTGDKATEITAFRNQLSSNSGAQSAGLTLWDGLGRSPFVTATIGEPEDLDIGIGLPTVAPPRPPGEWVADLGTLSQVGSNVLITPPGAIWPPFDADWFTTPLSTSARSIRQISFSPSSVALSFVGPMSAGALRTDRLASVVLDNLDSGTMAAFGPWDSTNDEFGDSNIILTSAEGNAYAAFLIDWSSPDDVVLRIRDRLHRGRVLKIGVGFHRAVSPPPPLAIEFEWLIPRAPTAIATTLPLEIGLPSPRAPVAALPGDIPIEIGLPQPIPSHEALGQDIGIELSIPSPRAPVDALGTALPLTVEFDNPSSRFIAVPNALDIRIGFTPPVSLTVAEGVDLPIGVEFPRPLLTAIPASDLPLSISLPASRAPVAAITESLPIDIGLSVPRSDAIAVGRAVPIGAGFSAPRVPQPAHGRDIGIGVGLPRPLLEALPGTPLDIEIGLTPPVVRVRAEPQSISIEAQWLTPGVGVSGVPLALSIDLTFLVPRSEHPAHATPLPVGLRWLSPRSRGVAGGRDLRLGLTWISPDFPGVPILLPETGDLRLGFAAWSAIQVWSGGAGVQDTSFSAQIRAVARPVGVQYWVGEFTTPPISLRSRKYQVLRSWIDGLEDGLRPTALTFPPGGPGPSGPVSVIATSVEPHGVERGVDQGYTVRWEQVL